MGNNQSFDDTTHIANAYPEPIEARVTVNKALLKSESVITDSDIGIDGFDVKEGLSKEESIKYIYQHPGFVKIMPEKFLAFNISGDDGRVFVSIKSGSTQIADNFPVLNNHSIIVDKKGTAQHAKFGEIWKDTNGKSHS